MCPAHKEKRASQGVSECDEGKVLVKWPAGWETADVLPAFELKMRVLFPKRKRPRRRWRSLPRFIVEKTRHRATNGVDPTTGETKGNER